MYFSQVDLFATSAALLAVWMCGVTRLRTQLWGLFLQATLLAVICMQLSFAEKSSQLFILAIAMFGIKAIAIPNFLHKATKRMGIVRDRGANIHPAITLAIATALLIAGYFLTPRFAVPEKLNAVSAGMAVALLFIGMLLMMTRRLAISLIIGFLTMENGIALYGITQTRGMPLLLEMAIVFEVLIGVLIAGLVIFNINRSFEHIDVTHMKGLRH